MLLVVMYTRYDYSILTGQNLFLKLKFIFTMLNIVVNILAIVSEYD